MCIVLVVPLFGNVTVVVCVSAAAELNDETKLTIVLFVPVN